MSSKCSDKIYENLSRKIFTKNSKFCLKFTKKMIKEMKSRADERLLEWCIKKLKKQIENQKIKELLCKYEIFTQ